MRLLAETAEAISQTSSKLKKIKLLADYLQDLPDPDLYAAAVFFTGRPFPAADSRTLNIGGAALTHAIIELLGISDAELHQAYLKHGDIGDAACDLWRTSNSPSSLTPASLREAFLELTAAQGTAVRRQALQALLRPLTPIEAQYVIKIITSDLRIGLKESAVEEAIAKAFGLPADMIRRANMALGDIGETAVRARHGSAGESSARLFHPIKFMLATPSQTEADIHANFEGDFFVEDKYDGIRAQLHAESGKVALFSRTLDDVSAQFPEIVESARMLTPSVIADGEIIAARNGVALPFAMLQRRLGRKRPTEAIIADVPVILIVFDLLYLNGRLLIDECLAERKRLGATVLWPGRLSPAPARLITEPTQLEPLFQEALQRRNEGLMLKDANSTYVPGKRGMSWMKWKQALATLDVVVTGVELGHGKRRDVLSDYTFAVRKDRVLLNIGKAYSGLTDEEIRVMTEFFTQHTLQTFGRFRTVEPVVVLEVAFNSIQRSRRHKSGFALRFPRIVRIRQDKGPEDIDTIESVERIYLATGQDEHLRG